MADKELHMAAPAAPVAPMPMPAERWSRASVAKFHAVVNKLMMNDMTQITAAISTADAVMTRPESTDSEVNAAADAIVKAADDLHMLMESTKTQLAAVHAAPPPKMAPPFVVKDK